MVCHHFCPMNISSDQHFHAAPWPHLQRPPANSEDGAFQAVGVPQIIQVISGLIIKAISSYRSLFFIS